MVRNVDLRQQSNIKLIIHILNEFIPVHLDYQCSSPLSVFQSSGLHERALSTVSSETENLALAFDTDASALGKLEGMVNLHESLLQFFTAHLLFLSLQIFCENIPSCLQLYLIFSV